MNRLTYFFLVLLLNSFSALYSQLPCTVNFDCEDVITNGCYTCDLTSLDGVVFESLLPGTSVQLEEVCGVAMNNHRWFAFVAGSSFLRIELNKDQCFFIDGTLQMGILDDCDGNCIATASSCSSASKVITVNDLEVGRLYHLWVDGCSGQACSYYFDIEHEPFEGVLEPSAFSAYSECRGSITADDWDEITDCAVSQSITACPGETITFKLRHQGSVVNSGDYNEACSFYPDNSKEEFVFEFEGETYSIIPNDVGSTELTLEMPQTDEVYETQICLTEIDLPFCAQFSGNEVCLDIIINPIEDETYTYNVCVEQLQAEWDVPIREDDPNGDGIYWEGPDSFTLSEVENWRQGCETFELIDMSCSCPMEQTICIQVLGEEEIQRQTLYMYACQFDEDGEYDWTLPTDDEYTLESNAQNEFYLLDEFSMNLDWENESCDSLIIIDVATRSIEGNLSRIDCNDELKSANYEFDLDLSFLDPNEDLTWPVIEDDYSVEWIRCEDGLAYESSGRRILVQNEDLTVCVKVTFEFNNGVWGDPFQNPIVEQVSCEKIFGPYQLTAGCESEQVTCPAMDQFKVFIDGFDVGYNAGEVITLEESQELGLELDENLLPSGGALEWWISDRPNFIPRQEGTRLTTATVSGNWDRVPTLESAPELLAISYRDPFDASEYFVVGSGGGLFIDNMYITVDDNCDNSCPDDCRNDIYGTDGCLWKRSDKVVLKDCPNIIPIGPGDYVPPNNIIVVYLNEEVENVQRSAEALCSLDGCIYVLFTECERCLDAFADEGSASYSLLTDDNIDDVSTLSYTANPDGGSVNSQGEHAFERDSLPVVLSKKFEIESQVSFVSTSIPCAEFSGRQYIRGVIVSDLFDATCCSPYTEVLTLDVNCPDPGTELIWRSTQNLPADLVVEADCSSNGVYSFPNSAFEGSGVTYDFPLVDGVDYVTTCMGPAVFTSTHTPLSGFAEGTTRVDYRVTDGCGNVLSHSFTVTVICEDLPPPPPPTEGFDDLIEEYPWIAALGLPCDGTVISIYKQRVFTFLHILTADSGILYFQDGTLYCTDAPNFDCVALYSLGAPIEVINCDDGSPGPGPNPNTAVFDAFPFLDNLVDVNDCEGTTISVYQQGVFNFIHIETTDSGTLYFQDGTFYCTDASNFSCVDAYGLSAPIEVWTCDGGSNEAPRLFADYPWLDNVIDRADCGDTYVAVYGLGNFLFFFVDEGDGLLTMYSESGQFYCQDAPGFSCLDAYGIGMSDFVESWECAGFADNEVQQRDRRQTIEEPSLTVFPNPTTGEIVIKTDLEHYEWLLLDMAGQNLEINKEGDKLNLSTLDAGIYLIVLRTEFTTLTQRIIKL